MLKISEAPREPAIIFHRVTKQFHIRHASSLKQTIIGLFRGQKNTHKFTAVDDLSFSVFPGESVALMGRNGSGKSTSLKMLSGVLRPDYGEILIAGRVAGLLEVGAGFHPDLTGRENVYLNAAILGMSKKETDERFEQILEFSEIGEFIDTEVKRYSSGMYARLGFSVAVHTEHDVLLVDEALSVGDAEFRAKCSKKMLELQQQGKTMFIVSHSAPQVRRLCQRGIVLDRGKMVFDGPIEQALQLVKPTASLSARQKSARAAAKKRAASPAKPRKLPEPVPDTPQAAAAAAPAAPAAAAVPPASAPVAPAVPVVPTAAARPSRLPKRAELREKE